ncbi:class I SAM-dependent methyltransferase [Cryptosporangium arvum]|uniref:class I SAM-dependent methyltransferase n=1 Tax=Cryptosporangium arvum TaxID=80871 RepID=UPI001B802B15|nr:class I SAM-dependent methyltransferase [Cryptosporangium arvum]
MRATAVGPGSRVLDVGCGSGEFLTELAGRGVRVAGVDPADGMVHLARRAAPEADVRLADAESLPWPDGEFDVVTAINALQFADDPDAAAAELLRVAAPGGWVAVANWAERSGNELDAIDAALNDEPGIDGELRLPDGLAELLADVGADVVESGLIDVPFEVPDENALVAAILFGEDPDSAPLVVEAARPFRTESGGYRFHNRFRYALARR